MKHYDSEPLQDAYEYALEWLYDEETAEAICDAVGTYGSDVFLISEEEWYEMEESEREKYNCLIGEDACLQYYVVQPL